MPSKGEELRKLIAAPEILVMPGVFNGHSARLVERMGYRAAFITGGGLSESYLGWLAMGRMGLEENVKGSRALAECTELLLLGDADTGYGNAINVFFAVREFESAGLAGIMIEDQLWPERCGHMAGVQVIPAEEMVEKVQAAAEGRRDPNFVVKARTDAAGTHGLEEAIRRLNLYAEAGADLLFADALRSAEAIETLARNVSKPLSVNMGFGIGRRPTTPLLSPRRLQEMGVSVAIYPRLLTAAAVRGMKNALEAFAQSVESGEVVERPDLVVPFEEISDLMGFAQMNALERRFVAPDPGKNRGL